MESNFNAKTFLPVKNEKRGGKYDMLTIHVNTETLETKIEVEELTIDSESRALYELNKRIAEMTIKGK